MVVDHLVLRGVNQVEIGPFAMVPMLLLLIAVVFYTIGAGWLLSLLARPLSAMVDSLLFKKFKEVKQKLNADRVRFSLQHRH